MLYEKKVKPGAAAVFFLALFLIQAANPSTVSALQTHGGPEGLYAHQGAHLFLVVSLVIFLLNIRRLQLKRYKAWRLFSGGAFLLAVWSIWAFIGHMAEIMTPESSFVTLPGHSVPFLQVESWREVLFYIIKMDHLICLPALLFFYAGLKKLLSEFSENGTQ